MSSGMWGPSDPNRKPDLLERFVERHPLVSLGLMAATGLGCAIAYPESWWGRFVLGSVAAVAGFVDQTYASLKTVPSWAWLVIIPLWGIWRRVASLDERLKLTNAAETREIDVDDYEPPVAAPAPAASVSEPNDLDEVPTRATSKRDWLFLFGVVVVGAVLMFAVALLLRLVGN